MTRRRYKDLKNMTSISRLFFFFCYIATSLRTLTSDHHALQRRLDTLRTSSDVVDGLYLRASIQQLAGDVHQFRTMQYALKLDMVEWLCNFVILSTCTLC